MDNRGGKKPRTMWKAAANLVKIIRRDSETPSPLEDDVSRSLDLRRGSRATPAASLAARSIETDTDSLNKPTSPTENIPRTEPTQTLIRSFTEPVTEPIIKPLKKSATEPITELAAQPLSDTVAGSATEPHTEPTTEPSAEQPVAEPVPEQTTERNAEPVAEPTKELETDPSTGHVAETLPEQDIESVAEPVTELNVDSTPQPSTKSVTEQALEPVPESLERLVAEAVADTVESQLAGPSAEPITEQPAEIPTGSVEESATDPDTKLDTAPITEIATDPAAEPRAKPATEPIVEISEELATDLAGENSTEPNIEPVTEPATVTDQQDETKQPPINISEQSPKEPAIVSHPSSSNVSERPLETPSLPLSGTETPRESLWDEAYESLRMRSSILVSWYETILSRCLEESVSELSPQSPPSDIFTNLIDQQNRGTRRNQMEKLLYLWLRERDEGGRQEDASLVDIVKNTESMTTTEAVLAWVAICYAASKVILNPVKAEDEDDSKGLIHIISRMEWYCHLPKMLYEAKYGTVPSELKQGITSLYKAILSYLMTIVCSHLGSLTFTTPSVLFFEFRRAGLKMLIEAENTLPVFNKERVQEPLEVLWRDINIEPRKPSPEAERPGPSGKNAQLLNDLDVSDPRLSIPVEGSPSRPEYQLYQILLSTKEYKSFLSWSTFSGSGNQLLWIRGEPGQGKDMLLTGIIRALFPVEIQDQSNRQFLAFFRFDHTKQGFTNPVKALKTIIWLILVNQPELSTHLSEKVNALGRRHFNDDNDFLALSSIFYDIIRDTRLAKTYIVIDALEECTSGVDDLLALIARSMKLSSDIKWLVSSDDSERFELAFLNSSYVNLGQGLLGTKKIIFDYIAAKVADLAKVKKYDEELEKAVIGGVFRSSQGNYLWVDIVCEALRSEETWNAIDLLHDVRQLSLDGLYEYMFKTLEMLPRRGIELCTKVLSTMALVHDTLQIDELHALAKLGKRVDLVNLLTKCSVFLHTDGRRVWFVHQAAKAFIHKRLFDNTATLTQRHIEIAQNCVDFIGQVLSKNNHAVRSQHIGVNGSSPTEANASHYSTLNWITHLSDARNIDRDDGLRKKIYWFLQNHFMAWVDEVVLRGELPEAVAKLRGLDLSLRRRTRSLQPMLTNGHTQSNGSATKDSLAAGIRDAHLFLRLHQSVNSPKYVHAYNTLAFCPTESIIRKMWIKDVLPWLESPPAMGRRWGHDFASFRHRAYNPEWLSVAASPDGKIIASSSEDGTLCIWDAETGTMQHTDNVWNGWIMNLAISSRGILAAATSTDDDSPVIMWDLDTGREVKRIPLQGSYSICFSDDGSKLAATSSSIVRIWDLDSETPKTGTFKSFDICHSDTVMSVAFSPGGSLLATSTVDNKVRVWDVEQKGRALEPLFTLCGHEGDVHSIAFSPDSTLLASGSYDGTIRIWELNAKERTFKAREPLDARHGQVHSVVFFVANGYTYLASCTNHAIDIWDSVTGEHVQVMGSQSQELCSMALVRNGNYPCLATGTSHPGTNVILWHPPVTPDPEELEPVEKVEAWEPKDLALSPDGKTLAVGRDGGSVFLWDTETNRPLELRMETGQKGDIMSVSFSPKHGTMLLSSSMDASISVCDIKTGKRLHLFQGHSRWVRFSTWSPNEDYVASASQDGTICIWKIGGEDKQKPHILKHGDSANGVAFSPNGKYIVTCGDNKKVLIWAQKDDKSGWFPKHTLEGHDDCVTSVLVTPDSMRVISAGLDKTIKTWGMASGLRLGSVQTRQSIYKMWFDSRSPSHVMTPYGAKALSNPSLRSARAPPWCPYRRSRNKGEDGEWVMWYDRKALFLPKKFSPACCGIFGHKVIVCTSTGQIHVYRFSESVPPRVTS